jgi:hypothetical protein
MAEGNDPRRTVTSEEIVAGRRVLATTVKLREGAYPRLYAEAA